MNMDPPAQETAGNKMPRTWVLALVVFMFPILLYGFTVNLPFMCDDFYGHAALSGNGYLPPKDKYFYNIYDYIDPDVNREYPQIVPWWTSQDVKLLFFRPLTSLSLRLDLEIWGKRPFGFHLTNILLLGLICLFLFLVGRQLFQSDVIAFWGSLIFCAHPYNAFVVPWCAERASLLSMLLGLTGLYFHIRYRTEGGKKGWEFIAWLSFIFAFLARESGAICLITYFLYDFFIWRKEQGDRWPGIIRLGVYYTLLCIPLGIFVGYYVWAGYGVRGYYSIFDEGGPLSSSMFYIAKNVFLYSFALLFFFILGHEQNTELLRHPVYTPVFVVMLVGFIILFYPGVRKKLLKTPAFLFLGSWIGISLLPIIYLLTQNRYHFPANAPFGLFMGGYLFAIRRGNGFGRFTRIIFYGLILFYVFLPFVGTTVKHDTYYNVFNLQTNTVKETREHLKDFVPPANVFFLNMPSPIYVMAIQHAFDYYMGKGEVNVFPLIMSKEVPRVDVLGERSLLISSTSHPFLENIGERIFMSSSDPVNREGYTWTNPFFKVTVEKVVDGYIRELRFDFNRDLQDESMRFFTINVEDRHVYPFEISQKLVP